MIPSMEPPITSTNTYRREFVEPLSREDALLIDLVIERFCAQDAPGIPPVKFRTEHFRVDGAGERVPFWITTLVYPKNLKKVFHDAKSVTDQETSVLRIPDGTGGSNGIS